MVPLVSGILITFFGGLTLYFDNKIFFYMKPTIINLLFAASLFFGKFFTKKPVLKFFFQNAFELEDDGWKKLNYRWIGFFIFVAILVTDSLVWPVRGGGGQQVKACFSGADSPTDLTSLNPPCRGYDTKAEAFSRTPVRKK